jgi:hypothetical protein
MRLVPERDEQKWLMRYMRKLVAKSGADHFIAAPIVEPTRRFFPEGWNGTVYDVHVVTQRLMHFAGLDELRVHMTSFGKSEYGHTAGWYAGIEDGRCSFGVAIHQMRDPEAAAGVMAHEVAHAWRHHHHLVADSRDREELLTDLTTIYLGFGILSTNNTDRYRSSGNWSETRWSVSSVGYLPPDSMAFLLALQAHARERRDEVRTIDKHLEPNQQACFRESMKLLDDVDVVSELQLPERDLWPERWELAAIEIDPPEAGELVEPPKPDVTSPTRNEDVSAYAQRRSNGFFLAVIALVPGVVAGALIGLAIGTESFYPLIIGALIAAAWAFLYSWALVCTACKTKLDDGDTCPGCGATIREVVTERDLAHIRVEQFEKNAALMEFEDCVECKPEVPCAKHAPEVKVDGEFFANGEQIR